MNTKNGFSAEFCYGGQRSERFVEDLKTKTKKIKHHKTFQINYPHQHRVHPQSVWSTGFWATPFAVTIVDWIVNPGATDQRQDFNKYGLITCFVLIFIANSGVVFSKKAICSILVRKIFSK